MISVILPNKIKNFFKTLENKSKTDSLDAKAITQFGLEKALKHWVAPTLIFKKLKELTRERVSINEILTQLNNRKHAKEFSHNPNAESVKRLENQILFFKKQLKQIVQEIKDLVKSDDELNNKIKKIMTIKGVGLLTVVSVIAETNGFDLIENYKQLTSYAGYDVIQNQSGYHTGKTRISKKGNKYLRNSVYLPAICAARFNEILKPVYIRLLKLTA